MPVTRPLLSCSPFLSFQSALRAFGQSCAQCPWFLHNLHFVQLKKSCSLVAHSPHFLLSVLPALPALLVLLYNSQLHLSLPLCHSRCSCLLIQRLALLVLVRPAAVVLAENSRGRGRISMHPAEPLGRCVFCSLAVPTSLYFHVGNTNYCELIGSGGADTYRQTFHTFNFSFLLTLSALAFFLFYLLP